MSQIHDWDINCLDTDCNTGFTVFDLAGPPGTKMERFNPAQFGARCQYNTVGTFAVSLDPAGAC